MLVAVIGVVVLSFLVSLPVFYYGHVLWLGWIGVTIGMAPHVILEILEMNPPVPDD